MSKYLMTASAVALSLAAVPAAAATAVDVTYTGTLSGVNTTFNAPFTADVLLSGTTTAEDISDGTFTLADFSATYAGTTTAFSGTTTAQFINTLLRITVGTTVLGDFEIGVPQSSTLLDTDYNVTVSGGSANGFFGSATITGGTGVLRGSTIAAAVPEPGTWALMLVGFGAIGVAMRRRRARKPILQLA